MLTRCDLSRCCGLRDDLADQTATSSSSPRRLHLSRATTVELNEVRLAPARGRRPAGRPRVRGRISRGRTAAGDPE